jgi:hypothetical protein
MRLPYLTPLAACVLLSACGGGNGNGGGGSGAEATPSLGLIRNATVNFYRADDPACPLACEQIGTGDTGTSGVISARITDYSGPMVVEVVGDADAEYFDEQSGQFEPFTAANRLRALTPGSSGRFGVTLLTELAYQRAVAENRFPLNATTVRALNDSIRTALAPELPDILTTPGLISDSTADGSLRNNNGSLYALKLAAFASLGDGATPSPALAVLNALLEDIQDGTIDGQNNDAPLVPAAPYNPATLAADLKAAMDSFATRYADATLTGVVNALNSSLTLTLFDNPDDDGGPVDESPELGLNSGITGIFAGTRRTSTDISTFDGPPIALGAGRIEVGADLDPFRVALRQISATAGTTRECASNGLPSLFVTLNGIAYDGSPATGGSCTITVTELTDDYIRGTFSGTLTAFEQESLVITNGEFQYFLDLFPDGEGLPAVHASFEGLTTGVTLNGQGDGTGDVGWQGLWESPSVTVDNVSSAPLVVTPGSGSQLAGGNTALKIRSSSFISDGRDLDKMFNDDVYISALFRVEAGAGGTAKSMITLGNASLFIGIDDSYDVGITDFREQQFFVSMGDEDAQRAWTGGRITGAQTYHVVGRLRKEGADTYNRFDLWVDPDIGDVAVPQATASRNQGTGSQRVVRKIGFRSFNQFRDFHIDRIQLSDSWAGAFADPVDVTEEP